MAYWQCRYRVALAGTLVVIFSHIARRLFDTRHALFTCIATTTVYLIFVEEARRHYETADLALFDSQRDGKHSIN